MRTLAKTATIAAIALGFCGTAAADQNLNLFGLGFPTGGQNTLGGNPSGCDGDITPNTLPQGSVNAPGQVKDLPVLKNCKIRMAGTYYFGQINIAAYQ